MLTFGMPREQNSPWVPSASAQLRPRLALRAAARKAQRHRFQQLAHSLFTLSPKSENQLLCFHGRAHDFVELGGAALAKASKMQSDT
jgi:hypothetical protein